MINITGDVAIEKITQRALCKLNETKNYQICQTTTLLKDTFSESLLPTWLPKNRKIGCIQKKNWKFKFWNLFPKNPTENKRKMFWGLQIHFVENKTTDRTYPSAIDVL